MNSGKKCSMSSFQGLSASTGRVGSGRRALVALLGRSVRVGMVFLIRPWGPLFFLPLVWVGICGFFWLGLGCAFFILPCAGGICRVSARRPRRLIFFVRGGLFLFFTPRGRALAGFRPGSRGKGLAGGPFQSRLVLGRTAPLGL